MGKGDIKSRKGKIARGSYGNTRKKNKTATVVIQVPKPEKVKKAAAEAPEEKPKVAKKPTAKKPAAKKTTKAAEKES